MRVVVLLSDEHMDSLAVLHRLGLRSNSLGVFLPGFSQQGADSYRNWISYIYLDGSMGHSTERHRLPPAYGDAMDVLLISLVRAYAGNLPDVSCLWILSLY